MSKANPYIPAYLDNPELAHDMRALANRLDAQADRFERAAPGAAARCKLEFRDLARSLRINADRVQPDDIEPEMPLLAGDTWPLDAPSQCAVCMTDQFMTRHGITCLNGHGGADSVLLHDSRKGVAAGPTSIEVITGIRPDILGLPMPTAAPALAAAQAKLDEHAQQRRAWRLAVEDFEVRNTPRGMRCAIADDQPGDVSFNRPEVRYLQPDEQPPLGQCWTIYPVNDGQGLWQGWYDAGQQPLAAAPAVCGNCDGTRRIQTLAGDGVGFVSMSCPTCLCNDGQRRGID